MAISRAQLLKELLPDLNALFEEQYKPYYEMHHRYGKYSIYKITGGVKTTVAKNLNKDAATGMMKLLEHED